MATISVPDALYAQLHALAHQHNQSISDFLVSSFQPASATLPSQPTATETTLSHLERILDSQLDLVCRFKPDTTLAYVNDAYCRHFGIPREQLLGQSFLPLLAPKALPTAHQRLEELRQNPSPAQTLIRSVNAQGGITWIQWVDFGITDEAGHLLEVQAVGRDVTELIEAQAALAEREEMLRTILANVPMMVAVSTPQGQLEYVNEYFVRQLGWDSAAIQEHPNFFTALYPNENTYRAVLAFMSQPGSAWLDVETTTKDGRVLATAWTNVRLSDGRSMGIGQVISERKQLEEQRLISQQLELELAKEREVQELKDRFISMVSHEFRTPLAVINTTIELVTQYYDRLDRERILNKLGEVLVQVRRMTNLMEDVLRFSKGAAGRTEFAPQALAARPLCDSVVDALRLTDNNKHHIMLICDEGTLWVDPKLFDHILSNLLANALKYSPEHSHVRVELHHVAEAWQLSVTDEGIGIPEEALPTLFAPFFRAENARKLPGTGLGLSIVQEYVQLHGGRIDVQTHLGQGTTFIVSLPQAEPIA